MKKILMVAVLMLGLALVVSACGGGDDDDETAADETAVEAEAPAGESDDEVAETSAEEPGDATTAAPIDEVQYCAAVLKVRQELVGVMKLFPDEEGEARVALLLPVQIAALQDAKTKLRALTPPEDSAAAHRSAVKQIDKQLSVDEVANERKQRGADLSRSEIDALNTAFFATDEALATDIRVACGISVGEVKPG